MEQEVLNPEQADEVAAWWRLAFDALEGRDLLCE